MFKLPPFLPPRVIEERKQGWGPVGGSAWRRMVRERGGKRGRETKTEKDGG